MPKPKKITSQHLDPQVYLNEKNHQVPGQIPYYVTVFEILEKERNLKKVFNTLQIQVADQSPLDISYCQEVLDLIGLPPESELKELHLNHDPFIDDYTAMVYGEKDIDTTLKSWAKQLKKIGRPYNPTLHKKKLVKFFQQEQKLFKAIHGLGINDRGPLAAFIQDWKLCYALLGVAESDEVNHALRQTIELGADSVKLVKKWIK